MWPHAIPLFIPLPWQPEKLEISFYPRWTSATCSVTYWLLLKAHIEHSYKEYLQYKFSEATPDCFSGSLKRCVVPHRSHVHASSMIALQRSFLKSAQCMRDRFEKRSFKAVDTQIQYVDNMHNYCCPSLHCLRNTSCAESKLHPVYQCWNLTATNTQA